MSFAPLYIGEAHTDQEEQEWGGRRERTGNLLTCDAAAIELKSESNPIVPDLGTDPDKPSQHWGVDLVQDHFGDISVSLKYLQWGENIRMSLAKQNNHPKQKDRQGLSKMG